MPAERGDALAAAAALLVAVALCLAGIERPVAAVVVAPLSM